MSAEVPRASPIRGRFNSWLLAKFEDDLHEEVGPRKAEHIGSLAGTGIEIGAGNGASFRYYPTGVRVVAYEPNPYMHSRLCASATTYGLDLELRAVSAERLDFEDDTVDAVVCTLVRIEIVRHQIELTTKPCLDALRQGAPLLLPHLEMGL